MRTLQKPVAIYGLTLAAVLVAGVSRWMLDPILGDNIPYATFFAAVAVSAWFGGGRAGVLASVLGFFLAWYCFVPPRYSFDFSNPAPTVGLGMYLIVSLAIAALSEAMHVAKRQANLRRESMRVTLSSIGDAVITTDTDSRVTFLNYVAQDLTGWTQAQASGQPLSDVFHIVNEQTRQKVENPVEKVLKLGQIVGLANHTILIAKDGTEHPIDDSAAPIRDDQGAVIGVVLVFRDIAARKQAEREVRQNNARKSAIFNTALDCIITIDHAGNVIEFNAAAERTFGYARADVLGKELAELIIPPPHRDAHRRGLAHFMATGEGPVLNQRLQLSALRRDGSEFPVELAVTCIPTDGPPIFTAYLRDITERRQLEQSIARQLQTARMLASIVESSEDAIISKSLDGAIQTWNSAAERLFGYTAEQAVGRPITMLIPADRLAEEDRIIASLKSGKSVDYYDTVRLRSDGQTVHVSLTVSPLRDESGNVVGASKIVRDITDRKQSEEALRQAQSQLHRVVMAVATPTLLHADDDAILLVNQAWTNLTGYRIEDIPTIQDWTQRAYGERHATAKEFIDKLFETEASQDNGEWVVTTSTGEKRNWQFFSTPVGREPGGRRLLVSNAIDVTEERKVQNELRKVAADLSEADRRKSEFLAMLAHELRNPLAPIRNALQILRLTGGNVEALESASGMMERQLGQMVRLIDDLLDVSRISRGKIELKKERVELTLVVNHAVEAARPSCESMGHVLTVTLPQQPIYLHADPARLAQVVGNLLNNACKFTERGGRIELVVSVESRVPNEQREKPSHATSSQHAPLPSPDFPLPSQPPPPTPFAVIRVRDNGIGIASEELSHIFELFTQLDSSLERSQSGLGIGLTLVQRLVEMHDGTVEAHSAGIGRGSEFIVRLPMIVETPQLPSPEPTMDEPTKPTPRRILVVDDNKDSALSLAMLLKLTGNVTHTAFDGLEAVEAVEAFQPDVVLLDIGLPKLNGYEAARRMREQPSGKQLKLVALTGWGQEEDRQKSQEAGFDRHMVKPVDYNALMKVLADLQSGSGEGPAAT